MYMYLLSLLYGNNVYNSNGYVPGVPSVYSHKLTWYRDTQYTIYNIYILYVLFGSLEFWLIK